MKKNGGVYSEPLTPALSQNMRQEGQYNVNPSKNDLNFPFFTFGNPKIAPHVEQICKDKAFLALK